VHTFLHHIHPPNPFPHNVPFPTGSSPTPDHQGRTCFTFQFSDFIEEKRQNGKCDILAGLR
jgi:hypothetical protein